jgi:hypothetical protein
MFLHSEIIPTSRVKFHTSRMYLPFSFLFQTIRLDSCTKFFFFTILILVILFIAIGNVIGC